LLKNAGGKFVYHGTLPDGVVFAQSSADDVQAAVVESVEENGEGAFLGFKRGDIVVSVDDKPVLNYWRLKGIIQSYPENAPVTIVVSRGGQKVPIKMKLPRMPLPPTPAYIEALGIKVMPTRANDGLLVMMVSPGGMAERYGLMKDDVILKVSGKL